MSDVVLEKKKDKTEKNRSYLKWKKYGEKKWKKIENDEEFFQQAKMDDYKAVARGNGI